MTAWAAFTVYKIEGETGLPGRLFDNAYNASTFFRNLQRYTEEVFNVQGT